MLTKRQRGERMLGRLAIKANFRTLLANFSKTRSLIGLSAPAQRVERPLVCIIMKRKEYYYDKTTALFGRTLPRKENRPPPSHTNDPIIYLSIHQNPFHAQCKHRHHRAQLATSRVANDADKKK